MFNWQKFLDHHHIHYVTSGPNVSRGNFAVQCPFCGVADPSQHMVIGSSGNWWRCWRNRIHRGNSPAKLVQALLGCSLEQALRLVGSDINIPTDFLAQVQARIAPSPTTTYPKLTLPREFKPLSDKPSARPYIEYLKDRGFTTSQIAMMHKQYKILYCTQGPYKGRIIFPIYSQGVLVTWTGRSIYPNQSLRYKTLSSIPEKAAQTGFPPAPPITNFLLWFDRLIQDSGTIYLCEGPFDALKVNILGRAHGIHATCFFTSSPTRKQIDLLHQLLPHFKNKYLLLDQGTLAQAISITSDMAGLKIPIRQLPKGIKDPGELTQEQLLHLSLDNSTILS